MEVGRHRGGLVVQGRSSRAAPVLNGEGEGDLAELGLPVRRTNGEEEIRAHARGS